MQALFVVNPIAGRGSALALWKRIGSKVAAMPGCEAIIPSSREETRKVAAEAARSGVPRVVVLGGDGTIDQVARELAGSDTLLAALPAGTGNDFCRAFGIPRDPESALAVALSGPSRRIDLGQTSTGECFVNAAGVGYDAEVGAVVSRYPKGLGGTLPYLMGAISTLIHYRPVEMEVVIDDQVHTGLTTMVAVANNRYYGGGMQIAPGAAVDDGAFDVIFAGELSPFQLLGLLGQVYSGSHVRHPAVKVVRGSHVRVSTPTPIHGHVDGDVLKSGPFDFRILPGALQIAVPPGQAGAGIAASLQTEARRTEVR